jgi:O-acetyl-ADP-ribose deacetylase (regulator of RNase III)
MKIKYVIGDMFEAPSLILMHGANAQGVMGSGVAATIRVRVPFAYDEYRAHYERRGLKTGDIVTASGVDTITGVERFVVNAITQEFYGRDPNVIYVDYEGVRAAVAAINYELAERDESMHDEWTFTDAQMDDGVPTIALPLIGAGLANGDWGKIAAIIEDESYAFQPLVYVRNEDELKRALHAVELFEASRIKSLSQELASATIDENKALEGTLKDGLNHK